MEAYGPEADGPEAVLAALDPEQREVALATRGPGVRAGRGRDRQDPGDRAPDRLRGADRRGEPASRARRDVHHPGGGRAAGPAAPARRAAGGGLEQVQARTFHSAALRQLSHFWPRTVGGRPPAVLDSKVSLLAEAARRAAGATRARPELRDAAGEIEWAKVTQVRPEDYPAAAAAAGRTRRWARRPRAACTPATRSCAGSGTWWTSSPCWS